MFDGRLFFAALRALVLFSVNCHAKIGSHHCDHPPPSCGNIRNISDPFRLKGDPENCGYKNFELTCENNRTVLYLFSGKYYVEAINYNNETIRLVDVGMQKDNCSSLPLYSLTSDNFSSADRSNGWFYYSTSGSYPTAVVVFVNCDNPVKSPLYLDSTGSCVKQEATSSSSSSNSSVKGHSYVLVGQLYLSDVADLCRMEKVVIKPAALLLPVPAGGENGRNFSFLDVHNALAYGFELRWSNPYYSFCPTDWSSFHCTMYVFWLEFTYRLRHPGSPLSFELPWSSSNLCLPGWSSFQCIMYKIGISVPYLLIYAGMALAARALCGMAFMFIFFIYKFRRRHLSMFDDIEGFLRSQNNLMPISYSYSNIKVMTKGFKDKLGEGGYGCVYKGTLRSGNIVAIKILGKSKANGQEFINEVATIGRIHHINVVRLIGYCAERSKRALVYDFMPNGSLEKYIFSQERNISLSCEQMYEISLGVARGIEYLHRGCDMQILHFDIKPHNILLDENFTPKVSDFGLAKLYSTDDSIVSLTAARGTMGYMAPELFYKNIGGVSYKADVYSFGMLLMEMAGRRRNLNAFADHTSQIYFPSWIYDQFKEGRAIEMGEITNEGKEMVKKMIIVGLWCIQMKPSDRPSMTKVVEMLEGNVELLQMPPKPFLCPQEMPAEDHGINTSPTEPTMHPQEIMPAEAHGINMNPTELPIISGDCTNSTILDVGAS